MTIGRKISVLGFIFISFISLYFLSSTSFFTAQPTQFSRLITIDLLLTIPVIYFFLIRKTSIPNITVIPVTVLGVILASYIIPEQHQQYLSVFKLWVIPFVELFVVSFILFNIIKAIKIFKQNANTNFDFHTILKQTCFDILPKGAVIPFVTEVSVFYYGFIYWKKRKLEPNEFTYHKESGSLTLLITILFLIAVETLVFHLLLTQWNTTVAWVLTGLSIYTAIQLFGFTKSIVKRPISISDSTLYLRYGIMKETEIDINTIASIKKSSQDIDDDKNIEKLSLLGDIESHNTIIYLNKENTITSLYGIKKTYTGIALSIDNYEGFEAEIEKAQYKLTNL